MLNKLIKSFTKIGFYLRRLFDYLPLETKFQWSKQGTIWLLILALQLGLGLKLLGTLNRGIQNLITVHQKRLVLEKIIEQTRKDSVQIKRSPQAVEKILGSLPSAKENYNLLERLNLSAANNQIGLLEVNFLLSQKSTISGLSEQPVEIKIQGVFKNVLGFLEELENDERPTFTEALNLETGESSLSSGYVRVRATVRTYISDFN